MTDEHEDDSEEGHSLWDAECPLLKADTLSNQVRLISEAAMFVGALTYIVTALLEARFLGYKMFIENLVSRTQSSQRQLGYNRSFCISEYCTIARHVPVFLLSTHGVSLH